MFNGRYILHPLNAPLGHLTNRTPRKHHKTELCFKPITFPIYKFHVSRLPGCYTAVRMKKKLIITIIQSSSGCLLFVFVCKPMFPLS